MKSKTSSATTRSEKRQKPNQRRHLAEREELEWFISHARAARVRTLREFAEQEIIIPTGPFEGSRFNCDRQPFAGLLFDQIDSGCWIFITCIGPTQSGKTLCVFLITSMYHLFEIGETIIQGVPDFNLASDKWRRDLRPIIERTRYAALLPNQGAGSRGGKVDLIQFRDGQTLKYMSGQGTDKSRSSFTARIVVITETDGWADSASTSPEADKITQVENRTVAYGDRRRIYKECTVTTEEGRSWKEYKAGTESRIVIRCPHCRAYVAPEREHLLGWQDAENEEQARSEGHFVCPGCGACWSDQDRIDANHDCKLLHRGQTIDKRGRITGDRPATRTLGFRWSAVHNLFWSAGEIAAREWLAKRAQDQDNSEKEMCMFVWAIPYKPPILDLAPLDPDALTRRVAAHKRGMMPESCSVLAVGVDINSRLLHFAAPAFDDDATGFLVDYGCFDVHADSIALERALLAALREFREYILAGWSQGGQVRVPDVVWLDAGWQGDEIRRFCAESNQQVGREMFWPVLGRGANQQRALHYNRPKSTGNVVRHIGEGYHISRFKKPSPHYSVEIDTDKWKSFVHARLTAPADERGSLRLFDAPHGVHKTFCKHMTAEREQEEFVAGKGWLIVWRHRPGYRANHWLDCMVYASAAAHFAGVRLVREPVPAPQPAPPRPNPLTTPDGRPFFVMDREK